MTDAKSLAEIGNRSAVYFAAIKWREARMDMLGADMKQDNRARLERLANAEDALSKAVLAATGATPLPGRGR